MESIVQLLKGLENDLYLLGALILPMVIVVRLLIGSVQKAAGLDDALSLAWRDVIIATVSFVLTGVFKLVVEALVKSQTASIVWRVFR
jgi:uncharacterized membrane protein YkgB